MGYRNPVPTPEEFRAQVEFYAKLVEDTNVANAKRERLKLHEMYVGCALEREPPAAWFDVQPDGAFKCNAIGAQRVAMARALADECLRQREAAAKEGA